MSEINSGHHPVILFDGVCNLCSNVVQFIIQRDRANIFRFSSLQSDFGQSVLKKFNLPADKFDSFLLYKHGSIYTKSTAALLVAKQLPGAWPLLSIFILIPLFIRNSVYDLIAGKRYKWFGKKKTCWLPAPALTNRFID